MGLFPHQRSGAEWLADRDAAYLADDCGLGKTRTSLVAAVRRGAKRVLVIAPASALENWRREWREWAPEIKLLAAISYADKRLGTGDIDGADWDLVILDEAHYVKNRKAKRTLAALDVARSAPAAWCLSATPMPNHPGELWPVVRTLWPRIPEELGIRSYAQWERRFCVVVQTRWGRSVVGSRNLEQLAPHLAQIMRRRTIEDVAVTLPPLRVDVSLLPRDRKLADALERMDIDPERLEKRMSREEEKEESSTSRLRRLLGEYKAPRIAEIIEDELVSRAYNKIVVLAYHKSVLAILREKLAPFGVVGFEGGASGRKRQAAVDDFTHDPTIRVFLAQQVAAGLALNLQVSHELVLVEPSWVPGDNYQSIKRIHRIGSSLPCRARIFAVAGSLDEGIMRREASKIRMQIELNLRSA